MVNSNIIFFIASCNNKISSHFLYYVPRLLEPYFARFQLWENVDNQKALQLAYKILEARPKIENKKTRAMKEVATEFINKHTITK